MQLTNRQIWIGFSLVLLLVSGYFVNSTVDRTISINPENSKYTYSDLENIHLDKASALLEYRDEKKPIRYREDLIAAIEECNVAIALNNKNGGAYLNKAYAELYLNDRQRAKIDFSKAIELEPKRSTSYLSRAVTGDYSLQDLDKAVSLNPSASYMYQARGNGKCLKHDYIGALLDYFMAIKLNPNSVESCLGDFKIFSRTTAEELHKPFDLI
ncbi:MAG: hypothetical protein SFY67_10605 [Candidatus Melainabacteria bacterium]|nr:hypothetical protein [Candidatus Melainabacteria bacterium]